MPHPNGDIDRAIATYPEYENKIRDMFTEIYVKLRLNQGQGGWQGRLFLHEHVKNQLLYPTPDGVAPIIKVPRSFDDGGGKDKNFNIIEKSRSSRILTSGVEESRKLNKSFTTMTLGDGKLKPPPTSQPSITSPRNTSPRNLKESGGSKKGKSSKKKVGSSKKKRKTPKNTISTDDAPEDYQYDVPPPDDDIPPPDDDVPPPPPPPSSKAPPPPPPPPL